MLRVVFGVLLIIAGVALGLYVGLWIMLVGGIVQIVEAFKVDPVDSGGVAWGVVRCLLAGAAGTATFWLLAVTGGGIASSKSATRRRRPTAKRVEVDYRGSAYRRLRNSRSDTPGSR